MVKCIWKKNTRVRKHNLECDMYCVNYIHGKMYMEKKKGNTRVRKHNLGGLEIERNGWFEMLGSISGWHMHY